MKRADSVLETLRRGSPEQNYGEAAARLDSAVRAGQGHVVVLGESQHEAAMFVDSVLARLSGYDVVQISIRRGAGTISAERLEGDAVLVVVHDADSASAHDLEELRIELERSPDAVERIRFVLVGAARLERALAESEARALASRVGARIRLVRKTAQRHAIPVAKRSTTKRWALRTSAVCACAALVCAVITVFSQSAAERTALIGVTGEQIAALSQAVRALVPALDATAATTPHGDEAEASVAPTVVTASAAAAPSRPVRSIEEASATFGSAGASFGERFANFVEKAAYAAGRAPAAWSQASAASAAHASASPKASAPHRPWAASKPSVVAPQGGFFATLARLFIRDSHGTRSVETGGAVLETALMSAKLQRGARRASDGILELGSFARAKSAYDLKSSLATQFDHVAVARFDPPSGPVYSVRVFDLAGQQAEAVAAAPAPTASGR